MKSYIFLFGFLVWAMSWQPSRASVSTTSRVKVEVKEQGVYTITYDDVSDLDFDPNNMAMSSHGQDVAYIWEGDSDSVWEAGESITFYGATYESSRHDEMYVENNIYWLEHGNSLHMDTASPIPDAPLVRSWQDDIVFGEDLIYTSTGTRFWPNNEPDAWYWLKATKQNPLSIQIELPEALGGIDATFEAELLSSGDVDHGAVVQVNSSPASSLSWEDTLSVNISGAFSAQIVNTLHITPTGSTFRDDLLLNEFRVTYLRELTAPPFDLNITSPIRLPDGLSNFYQLDITDQFRPKILNDNTMGVGTVFVSSELNSPVSVSVYEPVDLPDSAEWLAVAHPSLIESTQELVEYRQREMDAHVVNVEDVYNQFGHGFALPQSIKNYVQHTEPTYLLLVGDTTVNPLNKACETCQDWDEDRPNLIPTDLIFEDRFLGLIASDHTYSDIGEDSLVPIVAVGRIAVETASEMENAVEKVKLYESSLDAEWMNRSIFLADNADAGGNFCVENQQVANWYLPDRFGRTSFCLDDYDIMGELRVDFFNSVSAGAGMVNYRGHGSVSGWGGGIASTSDVDFWTNDDMPTIIISADCLDGHFADATTEALSEVFMQIEDGRGSVAHWSSTGLGYSFEHTYLHAGFLQALYDGDAQPRMGDAIVQSKSSYIEVLAGDLSEIYSFTLQGDPALRVMGDTPPIDPPPPVYELFLPIVVSEE